MAEQPEQTPGGEVRPGPEEPTTTNLLTPAEPGSEIVLTPAEEAQEIFLAPAEQVPGHRRPPGQA